MLAKRLSLSKCPRRANWHACVPATPPPPPVPQTPRTLATLFRSNAQGAFPDPPVRMQNPRLRAGDGIIVRDDVPCRAVPHRAAQHCAAPRRSVHCPARAGPCRAGPGLAVPCRAVPGCQGPTGPGFVRQERHGQAAKPSRAVPRDAASRRAARCAGAGLAGPEPAGLGRGRARTGFVLGEGEGGWGWDGGA